MSEKRSRGLGSLISSTTPRAAPPTGDVTVIDVPPAAIDPSPKQPRRTFRPASIESLAASIRQHGLLQPVVVRPTGEGRFQLIAGERRWRAAKLAGLETIRAICKPSSDEQTLTLSIVENLQREDLDPIEEASAYRSLVTELGLTHEQIANYVGKERTTISNSMRLLELPAAIQAKLAGGALTPGHARVLLAEPDPARQSALAERAANKGLSVRELERLVYGRRGASRSRPEASRPAHLQDLEVRISEKLGVRAQIREGARGGRLTIRFRNNQEFMRILGVLGVSESEL